MIQFDQHFSNGLKLNHQPGPTGGSCTAYDLYGMETWISRLRWKNRGHKLPQASPGHRKTRKSMGK